MSVNPVANQTVVEAPVEDPEPNKAIASAVTFLVGLAAQWIATGAFQLDEEGVTTLVGIVSTALVWSVSNWRRRNAALKAGNQPRPYER